MKAFFLLVPLLCAASPGASADVPTPLPDQEVLGQRAPLDSPRPRLARLVPCLGCESERASIDGIAFGVLQYVLLPAQPPEPRGTTALSMGRPELRADKLP